MESILVTGGTGTLGRHVVRRLRAANRDVRVLARHGGKSEEGVLLNEGNDVVQTAVTTGMLEAAANVSSKYATGARLIRRLGPKALEYIRAWDSFTGAKTPGT